MTATEFSPLAALAGGALIGIPAVVMMLVAGRVTGISGFVSRLLPPYEDSFFLFRAAFVAGLIAAPLIYAALAGGLPAQVVTPNKMLLIAGGLLVGIGTVIGSGCTSGHGVSGIARFSPRSLAATCTFMLAGIATVFILRHVLGIAV